MTIPRLQERFGYSHKNSEALKMFANIPKYSYKSASHKKKKKKKKKKKDKNNLFPKMSRRDSHSVLSGYADWIKPSLYA